jgi:hypothetical protein
VKIVIVVVKEGVVIVGRVIVVVGMVGKVKKVKK